MKTLRPDEGPESVDALDRPQGRSTGHKPQRIGAAFIAQVERAFVDAPVAFAVTEGPTHRVRYANALFERLRSAGEIVVSRPSLPGAPRAAELAPLLERAFHRIEMVRDEIVGPAARWSCTAWPISNGTGGAAGLAVEVRDVAYAAGVRERQRTIAERLLLDALHERDTTIETRAAGDRAELLASVGRELAISLDESATRDVVRRVRLTRPDTWCIVDLLEPNGMIHRLAVVHPDTAKQELASSLADRWYQMQPDGPVHFAMTHRPIAGHVIEKDAADALTVAARGPGELMTLRQLGFESLLVVPLVVHSRVLGALTFVIASGDEPLLPVEIALASDLADRCAMALDHARLFHQANVLRAAAEMASKAKADFLARMTHELRTPLAAMSAFAEVLAIEARAALTEEQRADLDHIKLSQQHLDALIAQILEYVQAEGGRIVYHRAAVPVATMLTEVVGMLAQSARVKQLTLDMISGDAETGVWADPDRMRQILVNVVGNAIKFSPHGGSDITLTWARAKNTVSIHVSDRGPGIPSDKLVDVFRPFVQLGETATERHGVGLGLPISRDLARAMHGDLSVESTMGAGSRFTLTLPRARPLATR